MRKQLLLLLFCILLPFLSHAQDGTNDLSFNADRINFGEGPNSYVVASVVQSDGKILIGGDFTSYNGTAINRIARLNADGSLDTGFNPGTGATGTVQTAALQPDGKILIGGDFTSYNGTVRNRIARLNADGSLDTSFNPGEGANSTIIKVIIQPDGKIIIGGAFTLYNNTARNSIARLNANGTLDTSFNPGSGANSTVFTTALQPDGKIIIGGSFSFYNGTLRNSIARLNANGSIDTIFNPGGGANSAVYSAAIQPDGKIIIGGNFSLYNNTARNNIARLNANGSLDTSFNPGVGANSNIYTVIIQPDGKIIIGGVFTSYNGTSRNRIARLNTNGSLDTSFNPGGGANSSVYTAFIQPNGKILIAGSFTSYNGTAMNNIALLNTNGSLDSTFNPSSGANNYVNTIALQPDGKIIIGGDFLSYNGTLMSTIARLNSDGSLDTGFNPGTGSNSSVRTSTLQPDGKILIGGQFSSFNNTAINRIARLNVNGTLDSSFNPGTGASNTVLTAAIQTDGKIIIGGGFNSFNGTTRNYLARLYADGSLDTSFNPGTGANNAVFIAILQPDGKIIIGGEFTSYNGIARGRIARLNNDGSLDAGFNTGIGANNLVETLALQPDGKIIIGGNFTSYNGTSRNRIARLNADGSLDTGFNPGIGANNRVQTTSLQTDGEILIGGQFTSFNSTARNYIARLNADGSLDTGFNPGTGANSVVFTSALQTDGKLIIGGAFTGYDGVSRVRINRLNNTVGPAPDTQAPVPVLETLPPFEAQCSVSLTDLTVPTATDNVDGTVQGTTDGSIFPITTQGTTTITWTFTDAAGNSVTQTQDIILADTQIPTIEILAPLVAVADNGLCGALLAIVPPVVADNCGTPVAVGVRSDGLALDVPFPVGVTTITWSAEDASGNEAEPFPQTVTVTENQPPVITTNGDISIPAVDGACSASVTVSASATDNCAVGEPTGQRSDGLPLTDPYPVGPTTILWDVTDVNGNPAIQAVQTVTVTDTQLPVITVSDLNLSTDAGRCDVIPTLVATASDNCSVGQPTGVRSDGFELGAPFGVGSTTIAWNVTDINGNVAEEVIQTVNVIDTELPLMFTNGNQVANTDQGLCTALITVSAFATDNCGVGEPIGVRSDGQPLSAPYPVGTTTVTWNVSDVHGNAAVAIGQTVTVNDIIAPAINTNGEQTVPAEPGTCSATVSVTAVATENCGTVEPTGTRDDGLALNAPYPVGTTVITWNAVDVNGNVATPVTQNVNVLDTQLPVITCPANIGTTVAFGETGKTINYSLPTATDNCGTPSLQLIGGLASGSVFPLGITTVAYQAIDASGNPSICSFTVTVTEDADAIDPIINNCPTDITVSNDTGTCGATVTWTAPTASDNSGSVNLVSNIAPGTVFQVGTTTVTYTATDGAGNQTTCSFEVTVNDTEAPSISCPANIITNVSFGLAGKVVSYSIPTATDNCGTASVQLTGGPASGSVFPLGTTTVTYQATDGAGNTSDCSFTVTVTEDADAIDPIINNCPTDITVSNDTGTCGAAVTWTLPTASDNSGSVNLTSNIAPGTVFQVGTTTVTYTATDGAGNQTTCSFEVTVNDTEAPSISCPANIITNVSFGLAGKVVSYNIPTATDNCGTASVQLTGGPASGSVFPIGTTTVTYQATDAAGNTSDCSFTVTVTEDADAIDPIINNCPADITVSNDTGICGAMVTWTAPTASDNSGSVNLTSNIAPGTVFQTGTTTVTYTATDGAGNQTTCSFDVTVNDTQAPVITCPANIGTTVAFGETGKTINYSIPTATDNCGTATVQLTGGPASGSVFPLGTTTVTYQATDAAGNTSDCSFTVTVTEDADAIDPIINNCPTDITVSNDAGICGAAVTWTAPTASDNSGSVNLVSNIAPGTVFQVGTTTVTYTATDGAGNQTTCSFEVTVNDTEAPSISCPANIITNVSFGLAGKVVSYNIPTATDNCGTASIQLTGGPASGSVFPIGTTTVTYQATDAAGNTFDCSFTVTVTEDADAIDPIINNCPTDITVSNDAGICGAMVTWTVPTASDNSGSVNLTSNIAPGTVFQTGTTTVTYTATDGAGNQTTCSFEVTVNDTQAPAISCPANIITNVAFGLAGKVVSYSIPTATDNCGTVSVQLIGGLASGSVFPLGTTTVTYQATDAAGNTFDCSFTVTVTEDADAIDPIINNCPTDITVSNDAGICGAMVTWTVPTASDNSGSVNLTSNIAPGTVFQVGTTTVTYTATDGAGNQTTCSFEVTVNDTQAPAISCPANIITNVSFGLAGKVVSYSLPTATDNCGTASVQLTVGLPSGSVFPIGTTTVTYQATDGAGNTSDCSFTVTVTEDADAIDPIINNCPTDITVSNDTGTCGATVTWTVPTASDNSGSVNLVSNIAPGTVFQVGTTTVTYTATDGAGNQTTCSFDVTVNDTQAPSISCPANIITNVSFGLAGKVVSYSLPTATDNCGTASVQLTVGLPSGSIFPLGTTTVTYRATDASGNTSDCSFTVTVTEDADAIDPILNNCPTDITVSNDAGTCGAAVTWTVPTASDNSGSVNLVSNIAPGTVFQVGTTTVTYTATDGAGNQTTCSFEVTVNDTQAPSISCPANIITNVSFGLAGKVVSYSIPTATDNCGTASIKLTGGPASGSVFPIGTTTVTYQATDGAGNTSDCSFTVTVTEDADAIDPIINNCPTDITVSNDTGSCGATVTWTAPTASDNSGSVNLTSNIAPGTVFQVGTTTVTYTATDGAGNQTTCSFEVTVNDTQAPAISCPANIGTTVAFGETGKTINYSLPTATDNCGTPSLQLTGGPASGSVFPLGTTTVTYQATDAAGNTSDCSFTVTVTEDADAIDPIISNCPTDITVSNDTGSCGATVTWTAPTASDNSGSVNLTSNIAPGTVFQVGTTTVTYTATDGAGNQTTCSFDVTVNDTQAPAISCPANIITNVSFGLAGKVVSYSIPTATDNCGTASVQLTGGPASGAVFPLGTTTVTYQATDAAGNTSDCSFTVTVTEDADAIDPIINNCPTDITVSNDTGSCGATVTWTAPTASDNSGSVNLVSNIAPGTVFQTGTTTVTYTATDGAGNQTTCSFEVTVNDTQAPAITCPANIGTTVAFGETGKTINYSLPTATDNCGTASIQLTAGLASGAVFPLGTTTVTYRATDGAGNISDCSFTVTVTQNVASLAITGFTLINAGTDLDILTLTNGLQISQNQVQGLSLNIRANTNPTVVGSVYMTLSGPVNRTITENTAPYALFGDNNGNYSGRTLPAGTYTLTARAYSGTNRSGTAGSISSIQFSIVPAPVSVTGITTTPSTSSLPVGNTLQVTATVLPSNATNKAVVWSTSDPAVASVSANGLVTALSPGVATVTATTQDGNFFDTTVVTVTQSTPPLSIVSFTLINAGTDTDILTLTNGLQISQSQVQGLSLNIRANTNPSVVGSVYLTISGPVNRTITENGAPYALFGDTNGNYKGRTLPAGTYTLTARAYSGTNRSGTAGTLRTITFTISGSAFRIADEEGNEDEPSNEVMEKESPNTKEVQGPHTLKAFPNPIQDGRVSIVDSRFREGMVRYVLYSINGAKLSEGQAEIGEGKTIRLDFSGPVTQAGMYILMLDYDNYLAPQRVHLIFE